MATHSSILAWRIPWTEKPGWLYSPWDCRVRHNWTNTHRHTSPATCPHPPIPQSPSNPALTRVLQKKKAQRNYRLPAQLLSHNNQNVTLGYESYLTSLCFSQTVSMGQYLRKPKEWAQNSQLRIQQYVNREFPDVQAGFRKGRGTRGQIANIHWIIAKAREFQKNIYSALLTMPKPLTV